MKTKIATLLFVLLCSLAASAQLKSLVIGKLTYIGEDPVGDSTFTVTLDRTNTGRITVQLLTPIKFKAINTAVVGMTGTSGPFNNTAAFTTPTELLFFSPAGPSACPCLVVAVQLFVDTPDATVTITLSNGETITTSSTVNVFLTALPGQNAIQLQQYAYVVLHAVQ
jgi:hypothetical protein